MKNSYLFLEGSPCPHLIWEEQQYGVFLIYMERGNHPGQKVHSQQKQHFVFKDLDTRVPND